MKEPVYGFKINFYFLISTKNKFYIVDNSFG